MHEKIIKNNSLFKLIVIALCRHFIRWPLYISMIFLIFAFKIIKKEFLIGFSIKYSFDLFVLSISSVAIILTALGLVLVIYDKELLNHVLKTDLEKKENTFGGFVSPYVFGSFLWMITALLSIIICLTQTNNIYISYVYLFFLIYSSLFIFYIIGEIIQHVIISTFNL